MHNVRSAGRSRTRQAATIFVSFLLAACQYTPFPEAFPSHFAAPSVHPYAPELAAALRDAGIEAPAGAGQVPPEVLAALPIEFAMAEVTGHLTCLMDEKGQLVSGPGFAPISELALREFQRSREFVVAATSLERRGLVKAEAPAFPHVVCFRSAGEALDYFDDEWTYRRFLEVAAWDNREVELATLRTENQALRTRIADQSAALARLNEQIAAVGNRTRIAEQTIAAIGDRLKALTGKTPDFIVVPAAQVIGGAAKPELPPFDLKRPYAIENDPWIDAYRQRPDLFADVSNKPWFNKSDPRLLPYLEPELADALQRAHDGLAAPDKLPKTVQDAIAATGFKSILVTSATRSPYRQAELYVQSLKKEGKEPAARYLNSNHMFGEAADINQPFKFGTEKFRQVETILRHFGLHFVVKGDRVHVEVYKDRNDAARYAYGKSLRRLQIARMMQEVARDLHRDQVKARDAAIFDKTNLERQTARLTAETDARVKALREAENLFARVSERLQRAQQELARAESAERERQRREARLERGPRDWEIRHPPPDDRRWQREERTWEINMPGYRERGRETIERERSGGVERETRERQVEREFDRRGDRGVLLRR